MVHGSLDGRVLMAFTRAHHSGHENEGDEHCAAQHSEVVLQSAHTCQAPESGSFHC